MSVGRPAQRLLALLAAAILGGLAVQGCQTSRVRPMSVSDIEAITRNRGLADVIIPFKLTPEMEEWAEHVVRSQGPTEDRLQALIDALLGTSELHIDYQKNFTGTAEEVFSSRRANCLAFTHLFVGMARHVGVPVYFLAVRDIESYVREGDLVVISDHIAVGYGPPHDLRIIDFAVDAGTQYRRIYGINDLTAVALFYSNRGAEQLRDGDLAQAVRWLRKSIVIDPHHAAGWVNLGVALRRSGEVDSAKAAYQQALELDPATISAYHNLAALLRIQGNEDEALELLSLTDRSTNRNPFSYLALGDLSLRHRRLDEAERFYRKAVRLNEDSETYAAMGLFQLESGNAELARRWLKKARKLDPAGEELRVSLLARRLGSPR